MAYNYFQPAGYVPMYQNAYSQMQGQPQQQIQMPQVQPTAPGIIWVDGYNEAAMYPIAPNTAVALWDKSAACIYVKKADATGKPTMQIFDLVERKDAPQQTNAAQGVEFATKTDLRAVSDAVEVLRQGFDEMRLKIENGASEKGAKLNE